MLQTNATSSYLPIIAKDFSWMGDVNAEILEGIMNLRWMFDLKDKATIRDDHQTLMTIVSHLRDTKEQFTFDEFNLLGLREEFHQFFLITPCNTWGLLGRTRWILQRVINITDQWLPRSYLLSRFQKENPELYANISDYRVENSEEAYINDINKKLYQAYTTMLAYPEITSNRKLFE